MLPLGSVWAVEVPMPKGQELQTGVEYYVLNVGTGLFLNAGEAWGDQAVVAESGLRYMLKNRRDDGSAIDFLDDGETSLPDGQYWLYCMQGSGRNHTINRWVDKAIGEDVRGAFNFMTDWDCRGVWQVSALEGNVYTLQVPRDSHGYYADFLNRYVEGEYAGVLPSHESGWASAAGVETFGLYYDIVYADHPVNCQFLLVSPENYALYQAKTTLAKLIGQAVEMGVDVSKYEEVVRKSTQKAEVNGCYDELAGLISGRHNPLDVTERYLANGRCADRRTLDGWTVEGSPTQGSGCWEFWLNSGTVSLEQTITNLPQGFYVLNVEAFTRPDMKATLQMGDELIDLCSAMPYEAANLEQAVKYFDEGRGVNTICYYQKEAGNVVVRLTADNTSRDHWTVWRNFSLTCYGNDVPDAFKAVIDNVREKLLEKTENAVYSENYYTEVARALDEGELATTLDAVMASARQARELMEALDENIAAWSELRKWAEHDWWTKDSDQAKSLWEEISDYFSRQKYEKTTEELRQLIDLCNYYGTFVTGIDNPEVTITGNALTPIFDLSGRKLPSLQGGDGDRLPKGVYIQNGRKFVIK